MLKINCSACPGFCCSSKTRAILTPEEGEFFKDYAEEVQTSHGTLKVLKQKNNGKCIFYDENTHVCSIYEKRPFDCRMYPYVIAYRNNKVEFLLDDTYCPRIQDCTHEKVESDQQQWESQHLPLWWIKAYSEML